AAVGGHEFVDDRFVAPREGAAAITEPPEEVDVFPAAAELGTKRRRQLLPHFVGQQYVAGSRFRPANPVAGSMTRPLEELPSGDPARRRIHKTREHRPERRVDAVGGTRLK